MALTPDPSTLQPHTAGRTDGEHDPMERRWPWGSAVSRRGRAPGHSQGPGPGSLDPVCLSHPETEGQIQQEHLLECFRLA